VPSEHNWKARRILYKQVPLRFCFLGPRTPSCVKEQKTIAFREYFGRSDAQFHVDVDSVHDQPDSQPADQDKHDFKTAHLSYYYETKDIKRLFFLARFCTIYGTLPRVWWTVLGLSSMRFHMFGVPVQTVFD